MDTLIVNFPHRTALPTARAGLRLRACFLHLLLGLGFLLPVGGPLIAATMVALLAVWEWTTRNPYSRDIVRFALQRTAICLMAGGFLTYIHQHTATLPFDWQLAYFTMVPLCLFDAVLAWKGFIGPFYVYPARKGARP